MHVIYPENKARCAAVMDVGPVIGFRRLRPGMRVSVRVFLLLVTALYPMIWAASQALPAVNAPSEPAIAVNVEAAQALVKQGKEAEAIEDLVKMASAKPPVRGASRELGIAYYRTGKLEDAEKSFSAAMMQDSHDAESEQMRGLTLFRLGRTGAAIPYLEHSRQTISDSNVDANYVLGRCYIDAARYDEARGAFAAQYGVEPASGPAYLLMAQMLASLELPEEAAIQAQKALDMSPKIALAHFLLGKVYLAKGDTAHALDEFEQERQVNPVYPPLYQFLGDLYIRRHQYPQAQHALTEALSLDQTSTGPFILMGKLFLADDDPETAVSYLQHAEQMDSSNYITHYLLATAYKQMGKKDDAKREFDAVARFHSDHPPDANALQ